jgi:hypothetical protein
VIAPVISIIVMALIVAAAYAVLSGRIGLPDRFLRPRRAGGHGTPRRDPQRSALPAQYRGAFPLTAEHLGELLLTRPWESRADTPELAVMSAHENHGFYHGCPICAGDGEGLTTIAGVILDALVTAMAEEETRREAAREAAQLPIVGVDGAVRDYRRQLAEQVESTGYYGETLS